MSFVCEACGSCEGDHTDRGYLCAPCWQRRSEAESLRRELAEVRAGWVGCIKEREEARAFARRMREFVGYVPQPGAHPAEEVERFRQLCVDIDKTDWLDDSDEDGADE